MIITSRESGKSNHFPSKLRSVYGSLSFITPSPLPTYIQFIENKSYKECLKLFDHAQCNGTSNPKEHTAMDKGSKGSWTQSASHGFTGKTTTRHLKNTDIGPSGSPGKNDTYMRQNRAHPPTTPINLCLIQARQWITPEEKRIQSQTIHIMRGMPSRLARSMPVERPGAILITASVFSPEKISKSHSMPQENSFSMIDIKSSWPEPLPPSVPGMH